MMNDGLPPSRVDADEGPGTHHSIHAFLNWKAAVPTLGFQLGPGLFQVCVVRGLVLPGANVIRFAKATHYSHLLALNGLITDSGPVPGVGG